MTAITTIEQLIDRHGDMIARLDDRDTLDNNITPAELADFVHGLHLSFTRGLGDSYDAAKYLGLAAHALDEAIELADTDPAKTRLIRRADKHLTNVDALALA